MKIKIYLLLAVAVFLFVFHVSVFADMAPIEYSECNIMPINDTDIRMVRAKVDIQWGMPCQLSAEFVMENESSGPIDLQVGFPMEVPFDFEPNNPSLFTISFDGVGVAPGDIIKKEERDDKINVYLIWYSCRHAFKPGQTRVTIQSKYPATSPYIWPYRQRLAYILQTGRLWKGAIGYEEVNIHFPAPFAGEQIFEITPNNYVVADNTVHWQFKDIEPSEEQDIHITYFRPDVRKILDALKQKHLQHPTDNTLTLKLARHLFALGNFRGYSHFPPGLLTQKEYDDIVNKFKDQDNCSFFKSRYVLTDQGTYEEKNSKWTGDRRRVVRLLNEIDYEPAYWKSPYVTEARRLVEGVLEGDPHNAEAWNIYLANYYRFRFAGVGAFAPEKIEFDHQVNLIKRAYSNCPKDPLIKRWLDRCSQCDPGYYYDTELLKTLEKAGVFDVDYAEIDYYHGQF